MLDTVFCWLSGFEEGVVIWIYHKLANHKVWKVIGSQQEKCRPLRNSCIDLLDALSDHPLDKALLVARPDKQTKFISGVNYSAEFECTERTQLLWFLQCRGNSSLSSANKDCTTSRCYCVELQSGISWHLFGDEAQAEVGSPTSNNGPPPKLAFFIMVTAKITKMIMSGSDIFGFKNSCLSAVKVYARLTSPAISSRPSSSLETELSRHRGFLANNCRTLSPCFNDEGLWSLLSRDLKDHENRRKENRVEEQKARKMLLSSEMRRHLCLCSRSTPACYVKK